MNGLSLGIFVLLPLLLAALSLGTAVMLLLVHRARLRNSAPTKTKPPGRGRLSHPGLLLRPERWLAVKSRTPAAVQAALGLHRPRPCSWLEGLMGERVFFIAPPLKGWIMVTGSGLPDPAVDVDECFCFVVGLSRKLGRVQFFSANRVVHHHAWVWAEGGRVVRAYAWAGRTLWKQGVRTSAERELGLKCFDYAEKPDRTLLDEHGPVAANVDKVPLLAARWSLDLAQLGERPLAKELGIAGDRS